MVKMFLESKHLQGQTEGTRCLWPVLLCSRCSLSLLCPAPCHLFSSHRAFEGYFTCHLNYKVFPDAPRDRNSPSELLDTFSHGSGGTRDFQPRVTGTSQSPLPLTLAACILLLLPLRHLELVNKSQREGQVGAGVPVGHWHTHTSVSAQPLSQRSASHVWTPFVESLFTSCLQVNRAPRVHGNHRPSRAVEMRTAWAAATDDNVEVRKMALITSKGCFRAEQGQKEKGTGGEKTKEKREEEGRGGQEGVEGRGGGEGRQGLVYQDGIFEGPLLVPRIQGVGASRVCHPKIRLLGILIILIW